MNRKEIVEVKFIGDDDVDAFISSERELASAVKKKKDVSSKKRGTRMRNNQDEEEKIEAEELERDVNDDATPKIQMLPQVLLEDISIQGSAIYGFRTPKRKGQMARKAAESAQKSGADGNDPASSMNEERTPKSKTPRSSKKKLQTDTPCKTPYSLRKRIKKRICDMVQNDCLESSDDSDYMPSESETESEVSSVSQTSRDSDDEVESRSDAAPKHRVSVQETITELESDSKLPMGFSAEDYFISHSDSKVVTSDRTLSRLQTPKLSQDLVKEILLKVKPSHEEAIKRLCTDHQRLFRKWLFLLRDGFNLLLHGLGSKRRLLNTFHKQELAQENVLIINGFFPSLNLKEVLQVIAEEILCLKNVPGNLLECMDTIEFEFENSGDAEIFLIVHNIDGPMLRNEKAQSILAQLSSIQNVHLIASVDHINSPLVWNQSKLSKFNFCWFDVTTFLPYTEETSYENSMLVHQTGSLVFSSLNHVFQSLTANAKGIFLIMVKYQLENKDDGNYVGLPFHDLYRKTRDAFLVSSDQALRAQLTEFIDHKLVKSRRGYDGGENLVIPVDDSTLQEFLNQHEEK